MLKQACLGLKNLRNVFTPQASNLSSLARRNFLAIQSHTNGAKPCTTATETAFQSCQSRLLDQSLSSAPMYNHTQIRTVKYGYRPNALKRIKKHGLEKRINSHQQEILFNKFLKGRHQLTVFDRFMNEVPKKPERTRKRVNLSDKTSGFRAFVKKPEYYKF